MKRMSGTGSGGGNCRIKRCIEGVAVYQLALCCVKVSQKVGSRRGGMMAEPPEYSGDRNEASSPWTWNNGMISIVRSFEVSW